MGCDAPVGWNQAEDDAREELRQRGWRKNLLGDPYDCLRCGAMVKHNLMEVHDQWHGQQDRPTEGSAS